ncbi:hypothetical protein [Nitrospirillum pindoramense]|nr:hypothetical protein [Nitrospirillum amazonense]
MALMPHHPLTLGITGHRPNRLAFNRLSDLAGDVGDLLDRLRDFAPPGNSLTLVSSLAEGADRIAASAALARLVALVCPLPFPIDEYCRDFADAASVAEFHSLLARAREVVILPGRRDGTATAYALAGGWMLDHVGLLIAIWDGGASAGAGGTRDLIGQALARGIPVIWLHATEEFPPRLLRPQVGVSCNEGENLDNSTLRLLLASWTALTDDGGQDAAF